MAPSLAFWLRLVGQPVRWSVSGLFGYFSWSVKTLVGLSVVCQSARKKPLRSSGTFCCVSLLVLSDQSAQTIHFLGLRAQMRMHKRNQTSTSRPMFRSKYHNHIVALCHLSPDHKHHPKRRNHHDYYPMPSCLSVRRSRRMHYPPAAGVLFCPSPSPYRAAFSAAATDYSGLHLLAYSAIAGTHTGVQAHIHVCAQYARGAINSSVSTRASLSVCGSQV